MVKNITPLEALQLVVAKAGSQCGLARQLGVSNTAVWKWVQSTKRMPTEHVLTAERLYGVSRHDLRPDIYPRHLMVDQGGPDRMFYGRAA